MTDLRRGWRGGAAVDSAPPGARGQHDPPECLVFRHPTDHLGKPATAVLGQYATKEPEQSITEQVWSWPTRLDTFVPDLTRRSAKCSKYTLVATDNQKYYWVAKQLPVQGFTDAFAVRYDTSTSEDGVDLNAVYVAFVVRRWNRGRTDAQGDTITDAVFMQLVAKASARLNAVVS